MKLKRRNFILIIKRHTGTIRSLCTLYYDEEEDRKDAFQDIVLQLWKSFETFQGKSKINTWIYKVSLHTILNNKRNAIRTIATQPLETLHQTIQSHYADDHKELLYTIIQALKPIDKAIVILYLEGFRTKEIAGMLKLSVTNVTTRFNRIKAQLKLRFKQVSCS